MAMVQHVYARIVGFGLAVMPRAPFRAGYADEPVMAIDVEHHSERGPLFARVIPNGGEYKSKVDQHTESVFDVVEIEDGPDTEDWRIETSVFTCCWPHGYMLCSNSFPDDPGPFDLVGVHDELIYVQKPKVMPDVEEMCGPDQTVLDVQRGEDSEWIELEYVHEGVLWRQRHEVVTMEGERFVVTMQAPVEYAEGSVGAARQVARSLCPSERVT